MKIYKVINVYCKNKKDRSVWSDLIFDNSNQVILLAGPCASDAIEVLNTANSIQVIDLDTLIAMIYELNFL